jgi:hypothetical protein
MFSVGIFNRNWARLKSQTKRPSSRGRSLFFRPPRKTFTKLAKTTEKPGKNS